METVKLSVEYFNSDQQKLFQSFPNAIDLNTLVGEGIPISKDEFLAYMMFTEQMDRDGFRTYNELCSKITQRLGDIDDFLSFNNESVQARIIGNDLMQTSITERIGVALGLCVINKIHGFTAADWKKIPTVAGRNGHPTFDFEIPIASTRTNFIQAENKGSAIADNSLKIGSVQAHYKSIQVKKDYVRKEEAKRNIPIHQNYYYGTIGVLDNNENSKAKVWLIDPPAFEIEMKPAKYKLLARLRYYLDEFKNIGVNTKIINALGKRIEEIEDSSQYIKFDNVPLDYKYPRAFHLFMDGKMFAAVDNNEAFGRIFIVEHKKNSFPYLIAFPKALMRIIILQNFNSILEYEYNPDFISEDVQVLMRIGIKDLESNKLPLNIKFILNERRKYFEATYWGKISHTNDGRIFGLLEESKNIKNDYQNK
jgi:hypothetical protein